MVTGLMDIAVDKCTPGLWISAVAAAPTSTGKQLVSSSRKKKRVRGEEGERGKGEEGEKGRGGEEIW